MMSKKSKGGWRTLAAGGAAGAVDCCFTMPMDTMSTQMQLKGYKSPLEVTRAITQAASASLFHLQVLKLVQESGQYAHALHLKGSNASLFEHAPPLLCL